VSCSGKANYCLSHRVWLFVGGLVLSGLIYLQQWEMRVAHARDVGGLATKEDIAKLPIAVDFAREYAKLQVHTRQEAAPFTPSTLEHESP
jgi:hypothetical protein